MSTDWLKLQNEYLKTPISLRALAQKHGVSRSALETTAAREGWAAVKRAGRLLAEVENGAEPRTEATEGFPEHAAPCAEPNTPRLSEPDAPGGANDRIAKLMAIGDTLTEQLAKAAVELDKQLLKHKRKTRDVEYDNADTKGKPLKETVQENYQLEVVSVPVDRAGLQKLSATLKNLREVAQTGAGDEQSLGLVAELMKKLDDETGKEEA